LLLANQILHITIPRRVLHYACLSSTTTHHDITRRYLRDPGDGCDTMTSPSIGGFYDSKKLRRSRMNLAILQTCPQAYSEAINIPYRRNTFDFADPEAFTFFTRRILPQRLASITRLHIGLFLFSDTQLWRRPPGYHDGRIIPQQHDFNLGNDWDGVWDCITQGACVGRGACGGLFGNSLYTVDSVGSFLAPMIGLRG